MKYNSITLSFLSQIDLGNVNSGWNEGVVQVLKKVERPDGQTHPYISGQAIRHYLRSTMADLQRANTEFDKDFLKFSPTKSNTDPKAPIITEGLPEKYIDDDIFGFMNATSKGTWRREAPLRVSSAYGMFPYRRDRDLGTRSAVEEKRSGQAGGSIYETEITNNIFRCTLLLELDRVGIWKAFESTDSKEGMTQATVKRERVKLLLLSMKYLWGGGRITRMLVDLAPHFIIYARMCHKVPIFLTRLRVSYQDGKYLLDSASLRETLADYREDIGKLIVGVRSGFLGNDDWISDIANFKGSRVFSISGAIDAMLEDMEQYGFED